MPRRKQPKHEGCSVHQWNPKLVWLGPGENSTHLAAVQETGGSRFAKSLREGEDRWVNIYCFDANPCRALPKADFFRESEYFQNIYAQNSAVSALRLPDQVGFQDTHFIADFLWAGDYAVQEKNIVNYRFRNVEPRHPVCKACENHCFLLALHLDIFLSARHLGMETLQLLAMEKFCQAIKNSSDSVLRWIVPYVYQTAVFRLEIIAGIAYPYAIAGLIDYRPILVVGEIVTYIQRSNLHIREPLWDISLGRFQPVNYFEYLREHIPDFSFHLERALEVAYPG
ncbi:uncharacterized protein N7482_003146 [Penicillium canariense]|uniref:Uncharacterized protein n=1 Tax=Penicillium canariense TaxID=189055 RepID=A0A9W9IJ22_9EURO|nr:uncharacterized protein N7482_003146 [Penicillium canariense]KAJ5177269.1 hypothetical protein N7482_003146 [Penicillium canariense]